MLLAVPGRTEGVLLEACILDGQLFCLHSRRYDQGYDGTVHPETGTKINAGICAAGIHPRSCGVSFGRGTLLNLIELKDKVLLAIGKHTMRYQIPCEICAHYTDMEDFFSDWCTLGYSRTEARKLMHEGNGEFMRLPDGLGYVRFAI